MMPSPDQGASRGTDDHPIGGGVVHLSCECQRGAADPLALCGTPVDVTPDDPVAADDEPQRCVVCFDLARTALVARRCERCPG